MTRVCLVLPAHWGASKGGAEYQAHCLAEYLNERGYEVVYLARFVPAKTDAYAYQIRSFGGRRYVRSLRWGMLADAPALYRALREVDPDVLIQVVASAYTGIVARYANARGRPMIWYLASDMDIEDTPNLGVRGPARFLDRLAFDFGVRHADHIIAQTRRQAERMQQTIGRSAAAVVPNFHPESAAAEPPANEFNAIWVANMKPLKRPELFIHLAAELTQTDIRFLMAGRQDSSAWSNSLRAEIDRLDNLEYLGELELEAVNGWISRSHVLVSTSEYEGLPNTFIQAWMRGVPTLSIGVDPDGVMAEHGIGYCARDYEDLRDALIRLREDDQARRDMGRRARRFALETYSMRNAASIESLIERVTSNGTAREVRSHE